MAKGRKMKAQAAERIEAPTPEQVGAFMRSGVMHFETATTKVAYRRLPVIDRLHTAGTINDDEGGYLTDATGNRRYWPVEKIRKKEKGSTIGGGQVDTLTAATSRSPRWHSPSHDVHRHHG